MNFPIYKACNSSGILYRSGVIHELNNTAGVVLGQPPYVDQLGLGTACLDYSQMQETQISWPSYLYFYLYMQCGSCSSNSATPPWRYGWFIHQDYFVGRGYWVPECVGPDAGNPPVMVLIYTGSASFAAITSTSDGQLDSNPRLRIEWFEEFNNQYRCNSWPSGNSLFDGLELPTYVALSLTDTQINTGLCCGPEFGSTCPSSGPCPSGCDRCAPFTPEELYLRYGSGYISGHAWRTFSGQYSGCDVAGYFANPTSPISPLRLTEPLNVGNAVFDVFIS